MKKVSILVFLAMFSLTAAAQSFEMGTIVISTGYGFPNLGKSVLNTYNTEQSFKVSGLGPLHAKFEYGISDVIGIGLSINHVNFSGEWQDEVTNSNGSTSTYNYKFARQSTAANLRLNFHFSKTEKLDVYWGFGFGYKQASNK